MNDPKGEAGKKKAPLNLLPPYALEQCSWVHKLGSEKYGPYNWRKTGVCASTYVAAIMRHLNAWRDGEDLDPESGISHIAHVACSCNILLDASYCGTLQDDRNKMPAFAALYDEDEYADEDEPVEGEPVLPPYPPLPESYTRWVDRGTGFASERRICFAALRPFDEEWSLLQYGRTIGWDDVHYIEAVKS